MQKNQGGKLMSKKWNFVFTILMIGLLMAGVALAANVPNDQADSSAYVGYGWNGYLPAYKDANGVSIPFKPTSAISPTGYQGDFYVDEFTDAKIKQAWLELKAKDPETAKKMMILAKGPNTDEVEGKRFRATGWLDHERAVNGNDDLKLTDIRRPALFGQAPYFEDIGKVELKTYTVEFTVPRDPYERLQLKLTTPVKLRGWFIKGDGVPDAKGKKIHALLIDNQGKGGQMFAIHHPDAPAYVWDVQTKQYKGVAYPNKKFQTEQCGAWIQRQICYDFNRAGFDVLMVDKRGHGISGGVNGNNTSEMAEDIFRMLDQLQSGDGLTVLVPSGQLLQGKQAAGLLLRGVPAKEVPVFVAGQSQGSQICIDVMHKNYVGWTAYNEPDQKSFPAKRYNIKGALLLSDFAGGLGHQDFPGKPDNFALYREGIYRVEWNTMDYHSSEILANIDKWPAVFFGKPLWDGYESPEGTYDAYSRAKGLKELVFIRGSHSFTQWGTKNISYVINKMTEFATRALVNPSKKYPEFKSFKEAVLSSPPYWEPTSRP
jgi:hypothetical protein